MDNYATQYKISRWIDVSSLYLSFSNGITTQPTLSFSVTWITMQPSTKYPDGSMFHTYINIVVPPKKEENKSVHRRRKVPMPMALITPIWFPPKKEEKEVHRRRKAQTPMALITPKWSPPKKEEK
jgi:hypothetical protein